MLTTLLLISGPALLHALVWLIVIVLALSLVWWIIGISELSEPFKKMIRIVFTVIAVLIIINFLLELIGQPFIKW